MKRKPKQPALAEVQTAEAQTAEAQQSAAATQNCTLAKPRTAYTPALGQQICERIARGETLPAICESIIVDDKPLLLTTFLGWTAQHRDLDELYLRARKARQTLWSEELTDIADDARNDWMEKRVKNGTITVVDKESVQRSQMRINARMWLLARLERQIYGDRQTIDANLTIEASRAEILRQRERKQADGDQQG
jgi:hypothetical protein